MVGLNSLLGHLMSAGGDMVNKGGKVLDTPGKKLLAGGAAAGLLMTETGRSAAKLGGVAALGALAYSAWQKHQASQAGTPAQAPATPEALPEPPAGSGFVPEDESGREDLAKLLITAMVTAAKADGHIDEEEQQAMIAQGQSLSLTPEEQGLLFAEMGKPFDMEPVVRGATTPEVATEVYAVSLVAVGTPSPAESAYLKMLAARLKLPEDVVQSLHGTLGVQPA
ncbi:MAG: tellurite resistance TerB family protein [Rhodospirillales bacterium]